MTAPRHQGARRIVPAGEGQITHRLQKFASTGETVSKRIIKARAVIRKLSSALPLEARSFGPQTAPPFGVTAAKVPLDLPRAFALVEEAIRPHPKAGMFQLAEDGFGSLWEQLVACILSIRTYDEVSVPAAERLFARARTPVQTLELSVEALDALISPCTYHESKAPQILAMAKRIVEEYDGELPPERDVLMSFRGVGPKCAALALGVACKQPWISVDVHVHRVVNRWDLVETKTPEATGQKLQALLPQDTWVEVNRLLMPFGKWVCTDRLPHCSTCPLLPMCPQRGVVKHR